MTELHVPAVIGTAASMLALVLLLLRSGGRGRRAVTMLAGRWVAAGTPIAGSTLAALMALAMACFAQVTTTGGTATSTPPTGPAAHMALAGAEGADADLAALSGYANTIDGAAPAGAPAARPANVPDVDAMIAKLAARLEQEQGDAKGWKMLGWSYLNTDRPAEAAKAYQKALAIEPSDPESDSGLKAANAALAIIK
jgi:cytochrome c-type biogenesis protein CcmH/NrfG